MAGEHTRRACAGGRRVRRKKRTRRHFYASPCSPRPAFDARRVEPHPGRVRSPTLPDVACRKRPGTAALHDASRPPTHGIHTPALGRRLASGAFHNRRPEDRSWATAASCHRTHMPTASSQRHEPTASRRASAETAPLELGSIRASRVLADASSAKKSTRRAFLRFTLFAQASVRREARRTAPGRGRSPTLPDVACRKRQKTAALQDASRLSVRQIHAPAFGLRLSSGTFDQQKQPCPGQSLGPASER